MIRLAALFGAALFLSAAASAGTDIQLPSFHGINVHGGGEVKLIYGPVQRVTVIKADMKVARITVKGGMLDLSPCDGTCWGNHELKVEVVTPNIDAVEVHGGGWLAAEGNFPKTPRLTADIHGGGTANLRNLPADTVEAEVHGGGTLHVNALTALNADVHGGGSITYTGHPQRLSTKTHGGGSIHGE